MTWLKQIWQKFKFWLLSILAMGSLGAGVAIDDRIDPYTSKVDSYEISESSVLEAAGTVKTEVLKNEPAVVFNRWNGEAQMKVRYMGIDPATPGARQLFTNRVEWKDSKKPTEEVHAYPLEKGEGMEDGGFEIEVVLSEKPATNRFDFQIEGADNLDFFYQPALTQEEIDQGAQRPENVIGSYAVYHKFKANHQIGLTNYATGKAYHIYRPKAIDANGAEQWAELSYVDGVLTVTVPQDFLDKAVYPVKVDPTFGYLNQGSTIQNMVTDMRGSRFITPGNLSYITSINVYLSIQTVNGQVKGILVDDTAHTILPNGIFNASTAIGCTISGWKVSTSTSNPILQPGVTYLLMADASGNCNGRYDTGSTNDGWDDSTNDFTTPIDPTDGAASDRLYSIYAEYTDNISRTINASNYTYCRTVTTNNNGYTNGIATTTPGLFPLFASSTISTLASAVHGGNVQLVSTTTSDTVFGDEPIDIVFTDESTCSFSSSIDAIPHYFEKYASTTGEFSVHLGTSNISSTTEKTLAMYYGNTAATNLNSPGQTYATTTWPTPAAVYDLSVPGYATTTYPDFTDSTYNNRHGSSLKMKTADLVTGQVDGALSFEADASDDAVNLGTQVNTILSTANDFSISVWFKSNAIGAYQAVLGSAISSSNRTNIAIEADGDFHANIWTGAWNGKIQTGTEANKWYHVVMTKSGSTISAYLNGTELTTADSGGGDTSSSVATVIGANSSLTTRNFDGLIDDVRIYNVPMSAADALTIYNNTSDSATFWTFGNEETQAAEATPPGTPGAPTPWWCVMCGDSFRYPPIKKEEFVTA